MMETDNPFEKVLDRLRVKGWLKGWSGGETGPNCIIGAVTRVHGYASGYDSALDILAAEHYPDRIPYRPSLTEPTPRPAAAFNDHPDTTFADVERVLEKAAVKWEEERVMRDD